MWTSSSSIGRRSLCTTPAMRSNCNVSLFHLIFVIPQLLPRHPRRASLPIREVLRILVCDSVVDRSWVEQDTLARNPDEDHTSGRLNPVPDHRCHLTSTCPRPSSIVHHLRPTSSQGVGILTRRYQIHERASPCVDCGEERLDGPVNKSLACSIVGGPGYCNGRLDPSVEGCNSRVDVLEG